MTALLSDITITKLPAAPQRATRERPLVLVAEDDEDTRFLFRTFAEMSGCEVVEAADGEEAVRLAESARPDLVLIDGSLPRLDGLAATRRIRELGGARVRVIFVSGHCDPEFRRAAREAGCDEFVEKPLDFRLFGGSLERHLRAASAGHQFREGRLAP
ncbi:MAG: response regulator [Acidobacteria bacterium]|nr:response regulator [Acidobacteriota bacterium]